ncbi:MAG: DUF4340 domain-containing protein [Candidatus Tectimicrobiota bacterium]
MSGQKTLIWAVLLLALGAFYYFYEVEGGKQRQEAANKRERLFQFAADDVTALTIKREQETLSAEQRDGHWYLTAPLAVRGDDQKYGELARFIADLRYTRVVEEQAASVEPFGLTNPRLDVQIRLKNQPTPLGLHLGASNPTGGSYYAQVEGRPAVYLVGGLVKDTLDVSLHALRDKTVLSYTPAEVQEIQLARGTDAPVVLQRQSGDTWRLTAPLTAKADDQQVRSLLQRLRDAKIQAFVSEQTTELEPYGLQHPALHVRLQTAQGAVPELLLGNLDPEKKGVYAKHSDAPRVFLLAQDLWDNLPKTSSAVRDKTILTYERDQITRLEIQSPAEHIILQHTGPRQYAMEQPVQTAGDGEAVYSLLWDIHDLKAKDFVAETPLALDLYGLDSPRLRLVLSEKSPASQELKQHVLLLGAEAPDAQGVYARTDNAPTIYLVDKAAAQRLLSKTAFDLRNRKVLTFTTETIQKLRLQYPTASLTVMRQGNTWQLLEPEKHDIPQRWKVDQVLYELSTLDYVKIVADTVEDKQRYGLDVPQVQITLWQSDGTVLGPLLIGKSVEHEVPGTLTVYAQVGTQSMLYALKAELLKSLPKTPNELVSEK